MPPRPSGSPAPVPAPEMRLGVLLSHLHPPAPPLAGRPGAERHHLLASAAAEAGFLTAFPCASGREGEPSGGGYCSFCDIVRGNLPAFKLYEDDVCLCILDIKPLNTGRVLGRSPGHEVVAMGARLHGGCGGRLRSRLDGTVAKAGWHSLIIPKGHFPSLQATPSSVIAAICSKLPLLGSAIMKATQCDAFNVLVNNGKEAGQVIFHTHVHIIPRSKDDKLWSSETYPRNPLQSNQETENLVSCIKELVSSTADYSNERSTIPKEL